MVLRFAVLLSVVAAATPSFAESLNADAARRFVANRQFSFTCFEGALVHSSSAMVRSAPCRALVT